MNPYASNLGDRDPLAVMAATPALLRNWFETFGDRGAALSLAPGKWSAREILCHLADAELVFAFRLRQALAEAHHTIQPFDQDAWATRYAACEVKTALELFSTVRASNVAFIKAATPDDFSKPVAHPERGEMTFKTLVETMAGHDLNHRAQLETISKRAASV
jgi:uncharacterized damage-inducible protein DinB